MSKKIVRAHLHIKGRVQGVFYRTTTYEEAISRELTGWVQNTKDGGVEAVFEGEEDKVQDVIEWCYKGPPTAIVKDIKIQWENPKGEKEFQIRY
jgi:acylphosphatase